METGGSEWVWVDERSKWRRKRWDMSGRRFWLGTFRSPSFSVTFSCPAVLFFSWSSSCGSLFRL